MKKIFRKLVVICLGVTSIFALLAGAFGLLAAIVDGVYYHKLHAKMIECNEFVKMHSKEQGRFPSTEMMDNWSQKNDVFPKFAIGARGSNESFDILEGALMRSGLGDYRIAYWHGEGFEFFNSWDESFTTSIRKHSETASLLGVVFFAIAALLWLMRWHVLKCGSEQGADAKRD